MQVLKGMFTAKDIQIKLIDSQSAMNIVRLHHYSGKTINNSQIHFGVFLNGILQGALQFGPSIDKRRMAQNLNIGMNEFLELNRMALSDACPVNSESRSIGICLRMLKKQYPFLKLIISFADACQCGDGTIYRASGFKLHSFKKNTSLLTNSSGEIEFNRGTKKRPTVIAKKSMDHIIGAGGKCLSSSLKNQGFKPIEGFQMKYIFFFDKELEKKFKFVEFDKIPDYVRMYKGEKLRALSVESSTASFQEAGDGESPINALQLEDN